MLLDHEILGSGRPLVIMHGLFGSKRNWFSIAKELAGAMQVIAVDLRNHGASPHADTMSFAEMAGDVLELLNRLDLQRAAIAGHSLGGKVAMMFALLNPSRCDRLIALDIAPVSYGSDIFSGYMDTMLRLPDNLTSRQEADRHLADVVTDASLRQFLLQNLVRQDGRLRWRINLEALRTNLPVITGFPDLGTMVPYAGPALFLGGTESKYMRPEHHAQIRRYFPLAEIKMLEGAGHWLHSDEPEAVVRHMTEFLRR